MSPRNTVFLAAMMLVTSAAFALPMPPRSRPSSMPIFAQVTLTNR
jgi:hypothetical protein